jgi:hypothetical protein
MLSYTGTESFKILQEKTKNIIEKMNKNNAKSKFKD